MGGSSWRERSHGARPLACGVSASNEVKIGALWVSDPCQRRRATRPSKFQSENGAINQRGGQGSQEP